MPEAPYVDPLFFGHESANSVSKVIFKFFLFHIKKFIRKLDYFFKPVNGKSLKMNIKMP